MLLLVATSNKGKLAEFAALLGDIPYTLTTLAEQRIAANVAETGTTFVENASIKATAYARRSGLLTLADDSGLEVDALDGRPGVYSARYGGDGLTDEQRVQLLLRELAGVSDERRGAHFVCSLALSLPTGLVTLTSGQVDGIIAHEPRGHHGFGYDPVFFLPERQCTTAELPPADKHRLSHRGVATARMRPWLLREVVL